MLRPPPSPTLFPYTTLFRSLRSATSQMRERLKDAPGVRGTSPLPLAGEGQGEGLIPLQSRDRSAPRSEEHTSELQSRPHLVCRLLLEKTKNFLYYLM